MHRREFLQVTALLTGAMVLPLPARAAAGEPILYRIQQGGGTVHILGFAEATDTSWFVPKIAAALDSADALGLETPPGSATAAAEGSGAAPPPDPRLERLFAEEAVDPAADLFAVLPPEVAARTAFWADKLNIGRATLSPMRPWYARITIQQAYAAQRQAAAAPGQKLVYPERAVIDRARERSIPILSEYPTIADLLRFFARLPPAAQSQYLVELFDYFDRDVAATNDRSKYGWMIGEPSTASIDQQRTATPDLYRAMHVERNAWWAGRIEGMLANGGSSFVMIGGNHVLGPDAIPRHLADRGLAVETL